MNNMPFISIIIPCRNEEMFIGKCLDSVLLNDYQREKLELFVVDGMSDDRTQEIVERYCEKYPFIKLLKNNKRIVPAALNIGIRNAKGQVIMRLDAHNSYEKNYISQCASYLQEYAADNVGGRWITLPGNNTLIAKSISQVLSSPFGVGNALFRIGSKMPKYVDTVPFGCYRRDVFEKIGLFNEHLVRNQDIEFNLRLKKSGGKILLVPNIVSYYHARSDLKALFKQNFWNGFWVIYSNKFARLPFSIRHLVPFAFVFSLISSFGVSFFCKPFTYLFFLITGLYMITNMVFSFSIALQKGLKYFPFLLTSFLILHISYGLGSLWGIMKILF